MPDPLNEFPPVLVGGVEIVVDQDRPVAACLTPDGEVRFATWPDLPVGPVEPTPTLLPGPDGAWMHYPPVTVALMDHTHDEVLTEQDSPAVHIRPDGTTAVVHVGDRRAIGATAGILWTAPEREQVLDDDYRGEPMPADWEEPTVLTLVRPDDSSTLLRVDRYVLATFEAGGAIHIVVAPTPPIAERDGFGGVSYNYRVSEIALPADEPLPDRIRFLDHHPDGIGPAVEPRRCWWNAHSYDLPPSPVRTIDLTGIPDSRWTPIRLSDQQIQDAVAAAAGIFGDANEFWHAPDGSVGPLASGMSDAEVHTEEAWPDTRVVITFRYEGYPVGRLRRSIRVFDDAGRIAVNTYADIYLMEDLDTGHLPPAHHARDGYLDI